MIDKLIKELKLTDYYVKNHNPRINISRFPFFETIEGRRIMSEFAIKKISIDLWLNSNKIDWQIDGNIKLIYFSDILQSDF